MLPTNLCQLWSREGFPAFYSLLHHTVAFLGACGGLRLEGSGPRAFLLTSGLVCRQDNFEHAGRGRPSRSSPAHGSCLRYNRADWSDADMLYNLDVASAICSVNRVVGSISRLICQTPKRHRTQKIVLSAETAADLGEDFARGKPQCRTSFRRIGVTSML